MSVTVWKFLEGLKTAQNVIDTAVLILNQPIASNPEMVVSLWKKANLRCICDGGSNAWLNFIRKENRENLPLPDFICGDFDSITQTTKEYFRNRIVNFINTPDQDHSDFTKGLNLLTNKAVEKNIYLKYIFVICENSGRFDQIIGNVNTIVRHPNQPVIIVSSQSITWILRKGVHEIIVTKDFIEKDYTCGLIPFSGPTKITTTGLKWNLENNICEIGGLISTSNGFTSQNITVSCDQDIIWTTEYLKP